MLTSDGNRAARRFVEAARSAWLAAVPQKAYAALDAAAPRMSNPVVRAEATHVRGLLEWRRGSSAEAHRILLAGAGPAARVAPGTALAMLVLAQEAAGYVGDVEGLAAAGAVADTVDPGEDRDAVLHKLVAVGFGHVVTGRVDSGVALLRAATERAGQVEDLQQLTVLCHAAASYGDQVTAAQLAERAVRVARSGHLSIWLPHASEYCVYADCARGHLAAAAALATEGLDLAPPDADELFHEAGELLEATPLPLQTARTHLLHGEWLRRQRRRVDARVHLRLALEIFERLGARPWEARARAELRATGETARKRAPSTADQLTPQELQIVRIVRDGATNRDVAAQLFLSPRTVDHRLRKVFVKLGLTSRAELFRLDVGDGAPTGTRSAVAAG
ncbi:helix-turn-helix transcriptional regulator [Geodermatophilus sp. YIM 151500]|uniref:helix-turn-helix domain-containing protein n=1 Tax=Geodermatophilus sp. YIM 151500 TaxID=2984531 RepID=UPI0021E3DCC2|nr:helix-turn-helix transcriptional regulator [Geodermatophilus sp. YIM 151500]MCV2488379.1 helix-turn-helix transcriptional regulator [Geodermatophilus sp. YIM 151500]